MQPLLAARAIPVQACHMPVSRFYLERGCSQGHAAMPQMFVAAVVLHEPAYTGAAFASRPLRQPVPSGYRRLRAPVHLRVAVDHQVESAHGFHLHLEIRPAHRAHRRKQDQRDSRKRVAVRAYSVSSICIFSPSILPLDGVSVTDMRQIVSNVSRWCPCYLSLSQKFILCTNQCHETGKVQMILVGSLQGK